MNVKFLFSYHGNEGFYDDGLVYLKGCGFFLLKDSVPSFIEFMNEELKKRGNKKARKLTLD